MPNLDRVILLASFYVFLIINSSHSLTFEPKTYALRRLLAIIRTRSN